MGSDWDDELESAYTTIENQSYIVEQRNLLGLFWSDSITTVSPLKKLLDTHITEALIDAIAVEYQSGRRLYIGTSNLDSQTFTVWNMGAIASEGSDKALELFKQVLLASASIPILMPPTLFEVDIDGKSYDEMHADGGVNTQFFIPLRVINLNEAIENAQDNGFQFTPRPRMYIIRNARFVPHPKVVDRNLASITEGTITSMVQAMGRADLYQIFSIARARGNDFRYTEVPEDFEWQSEDEFNGPEMRRLFSIGVEQGLHKDPWKRTPPGLYHLNSGD
ncbi:lipoprotein [Vibrio sp. JCM 19236]|nr:lipoprotein [Vibrio sp. JCM 19236]